MLPALALVVAAAAANPPSRPAAPPPAAAAAERVIEEVVAEIRNPRGAPPRIVTLTKLREEARIALVSRGATAAATGPLDRAALRAALEWLLDETLVADEAGRLRVAEVGREEAVAELARFRARFASPAEYERFLAGSELGEEEVLVSLRRTLRVRRYLESRVGSAARVGEEEVDRWLRERGAPAAGPAARDAARDQLVEERARAQVKDLVAELRGRAEVRIVGLGSATED